MGILWHFALLKSEKHAKKKKLAVPSFMSKYLDLFLAKGSVLSRLCSGPCYNTVPV